MSCLLCQSTNHKKREGKVRDNPSLEILECCECGLVFLSHVEHINETFYENSGMHEKFDFGKWRKQTYADDKRRYEFVKPFIENKSVLDFGSGNGGFLQNAKKTAKNIAGVELEKAVIPFYKEQNLPLYCNIDEIETSFDVITSFHVIEHIKNPHTILKQLKKHLNDKGKLIIEVPNANDALLTLYKSKAFSHFTYWSCHLYLYTAHTLQLLAQQCGFEVKFIKHIQRYPLSNHLYWLSYAKPGGHEKWGELLDSEALSQAYEAQLASLEATDTIMACFTKTNEQ
jgi:2-polyprenyl-3-methyl-5-hydroxy-6-metoxy-1,4-benzoquinol methylase